MTLRRGESGGVDLKNAAFGALVAAFPNTGFMGVPLLVALFGDRAAGPVIGTMLVDLILTSTLCVALAQAQRRPAAAAPQRSPPQPLAQESAAAAPAGRAPSGVGRRCRNRGAKPAVAARALRGALPTRCRGRSRSAPLRAALGIARCRGRSRRSCACSADSATPVALFTIGAVL